jgi:hypothetical protein
MTASSNARACASCGAELLSDGSCLNCGRPGSTAPTPGSRSDEEEFSLSRSISTQTPALSTDYRQLIEKIETYTPSGRISLLTIPLMLVIGGAAGIGVAFVVHLIWQAIGYYLIVIFPAAIGIAAGFGVSIGVTAGRNRNVPLGLIVGLAVGLVSYMSMHYFDSRSADSPDLLAYLEMMADEGYSIFFIPISGIFVWITWVIEAVIVAFLTVSIAGGSSQEAFCEDCNRWTTNRRLFTSAPDSVAAIVTSVSEKRYHQLKELIGKQFSDRNKLDVDLSYCDHCRRQGYLTLTSTTPGDGDDDKEEEVVLYQATLGAHTGTLLRDFPEEPSS